MKKDKKQHSINQEIRATEVRVTDEGIMLLTDALALAQSKFMDLVLLNDKVTPAICKIMNYEKFLYDLSKKPKNKTLDVKEIKLGPYTSENDLSYRVKHAIEFLKKGHSVRVTLQFKGREMAHIELGEALILKLLVAVEEVGIAESLPKLEGKKMGVMIKPKTK